MKQIFSAITCLLLFFSCAPEEQAPELLKLASGTVERIENFPSEFITPRNVEVWLPDGYSTDQKYAVLYMHDGQMLFDSTTTWNKQEWGVDEIMGRLLAEGSIQSTIVVGIWNTENRHSEYFPQRPFESLSQTYQDSLLTHATDLFKISLASDSYLEFLVKEVKPYIDSAYSTHADAAHTFIAGSSMGGLISMYALCEYPEVFSGAACLSTHWIGVFDTLNNPIPAAFVAYLEENLPNPADHRLYFDFGTETLDAFYEPHQTAVDAIMKAKGYDEQNWRTLKFSGENHSEIAWNKRFEIPMTFLLGEEK
ncbi:MAG: alpha/beta hydrolase-fold protein [Bacteroidota bacterium]